MKKIIPVVILMLFITGSTMASETVNINNPTADKNWVSSYKESYTPSSTRPEKAPSVIGIRSLSSNSVYDYKQTRSSLAGQAEKLYVNSFKELFPIGSDRYLSNLVGRTKTSVITANTGNQILDSHETYPYAGLAEEEIKWLINNNIISRDPEVVRLGKDEVTFGSWVNGGLNSNTYDYDEPQIYGDNLEIPTVLSFGVAPVYELGEANRMKRSDFLMALHKATYGVIESRPLVVDVTPRRFSRPVVWERINDTYFMRIGETWMYQPVRDQTLTELRNVEIGGKTRYQRAKNTDLNTTEEFRGEYITRLEGDTNYIVATFPDYDKLFLTSPNVVELYLKSYIDKGIISLRNLLDTADDAEPEAILSNVLSKNKLKSELSLWDEFVNYGRMRNTESQYYPSYAPEIGPYDEQGVSHTFFEPTILGSYKKDGETGYMPWGR